MFWIQHSALWRKFFLKGRESVSPKVTAPNLLLRRMPVCVIISGKGNFKEEKWSVGWKHNCSSNFQGESEKKKARNSHGFCFISMRKRSIWEDLYEPQHSCLTLNYTKWLEFLVFWLMLRSCWTVGLTWVLDSDDYIVVHHVQSDFIYAIPFPPPSTMRRESPNVTAGEGIAREADSFPKITQVGRSGTILHVGPLSQVQCPVYFKRSHLSKGSVSSFLKRDDWTRTIPSEVP